MGAKPIIVIVTGAFHRPAHYETVSKPLQEKGFHVVVPTLSTGNGDAEMTHFDDVKAIHSELLPLLDEGNEAVVVSHSYGSLPASHSIEGQTVSERAARGLKGGIKHYICVTGMVYPAKGKSFMGDDSEFPAMPYHRVENGLTYLLESAKPVFYNDLASDEIDKIWPTLNLVHSRKAFTTFPSFIDAEIQCPKTWVYCENDVAITPEYQDYSIKNGDYKDIIRVPSGHSPFFKVPERLVDIITEVAGRA